MSVVVKVVFYKIRKNIASGGQTVGAMPAKEKSRISVKKCFTVSKVLEHVLRLPCPRCYTSFEVPVLEWVRRLEWLISADASLLLQVQLREELIWITWGADMNLQKKEKYTVELHFKHVFFLTVFCWSAREMQFIFYIECGFKTFLFKFTFYALHAKTAEAAQMSIIYRTLVLDFRETVLALYNCVFHMSQIVRLTG